MLQRRQQQEWMMLQQLQRQQQSQLQAQQEEWMCQQLALQQTAPPMPLLPLVPSVDSSLTLPLPPTFALQHGAVNRSLSTRTTDVAPVLSAASVSSADTSFASADVDTYDMPPAYSLTDHPTS